MVAVVDFYSSLRVDVCFDLSIVPGGDINGDIRLAVDAVSFLGAAGNVNGHVRIGILQVLLLGIASKFYGSFWAVIGQGSSLGAADGIHSSIEGAVDPMLPMAGWV